MPLQAIYLDSRRRRQSQSNWLAFALLPLALGCGYALWREVALSAVQWQFDWVPVLGRQNVIFLHTQLMRRELRQAHWNSDENHGNKVLSSKGRARVRRVWSAEWPRLSTHGDPVAERAPQATVERRVGGVAAEAAEGS